MVAVLLITFDDTHSALRSASPSPGGAQGPGLEPALRAIQSRSSSASRKIRGGDWRPRAQQRRVPRGLHALALCMGGAGQQPNRAQGPLSFWGTLEQVKKGSLPVIPSEACGTHTRECQSGVFLSLSLFFTSSFSPWLLHPSLASSIPFLERGARCGRTSMAQEIGELAVGGEGRRLLRSEAAPQPLTRRAASLCSLGPSPSPCHGPTDQMVVSSPFEKTIEFFLCSLRLILSL